MLRADAYIKGTACISPGKTPDSVCILDDTIVVNESNFLKCIEPIYKKYIDPMVSRRMSRVVKMGIYAAKECLEDAGVEIPGAIVTGTGLGCIEDTEKFIDNIFRNEEKLLNPTPFIQSTHNTIGSQIALLLKCHNYNVTYSQRGLTFESALFDSMLLLKEKSVENVLLGGVDEITNISYQIMKRLGHWKKEKIERAHLLNSNTKGSIAGEGAAFFMLTNKPAEKSYARISAVKTINDPMDSDGVKQALNKFLSENEIGIHDIDLALLGFNGDKNFDSSYNDLMNTSLNKINCGYFKHMCGEYYTSSSFALWLAAVILKDQQVPEIIKIQNNKPVTKLKNILICNSYRNINHSFILLQHV